MLRTLQLAPGGLLFGFIDKLTRNAQQDWQDLPFVASRNHRDFHVVLDVLNIICSNHYFKTVVQTVIYCISKKVHIVLYHLFAVEF